MTMKFWGDLTERFFREFFLPYLKEWKLEKEKEGLIPTVELLIEELEEKYK